MDRFNKKVHKIASPLGSVGAAKSSSKKRANPGGGRLRLMPLDASASYEMPSGSSNQSTNNNITHLAPTSSGLPSGLMSSSYGVGKLKKITQKKELLEAVRKANSPIVLPTREQPGREGGGGSASVLRHESSSSSINDDDGSAARDIECLEDGVHANARKFNEHKMMADKRQRELNMLLDELRSLQLETQELSRVQNQETPVAKQNLRIRTEIQACTTSMEEQMHQRRQLEHMVRRLQTSQLKVDAHLEGMARTVEASQHEADEVKLLCRQLEAGKNRAIQFLQEVQLQIQTDRKTRARELIDHEIRAKNAQKMEVWRFQRMQERAEVAAELRGDLSAEEEQRLLRCIESRQRANESLHIANMTKSEKAADYDDVLEQLKVAMGATSLQEVVEKIQAQAITATSLEKEKTHAESRLISVRQEKEHAVQALNEVKASGIGGIELNREVYNTLENEIQQAKATLKVNKAAFERLDGVIQAVRQGSFGLAQRLQTFDDVLDLATMESANGVPPSPLVGDGAGVIPLTNVIVTSPGGLTPVRLENADCLAVAELKLTRMLELVGQQSSAVNGFGAGGFGNGTGSSSSPGDGSEEGFDDSATSRADFLDDRNTLWSPTANNDPQVHRNNIRVQPQRPRLQGSYHVDPDDLEPLISARSDVSTSSEPENMDVLVPSRDILKMSSSRHFAEVIRKKEMAEKQKVAAERGISDEELMSKLRKKNQLEADARLATSPTRQQPLLAPSLKDDTLSKSLAFVTQLTFNEL
ncbi:hypothetical protein Poli38472_004172 [Pythium oligandrum]|uniref:Uncharacterized protein n=1 Tax=Pythium oligandrum TaxID=41045 RepID=A0A8K1FP02_PYTOL|nr:hypothetical protein Poli38472_004172 [Pythium oligandrum]|eukprot:TMW66407.1 hypothetical protein Poli38472_004172 [Pythium oligandrum]